MPMAPTTCEPMVLASETRASRPPEVVEFACCAPSIELADALDDRTGELKYREDNHEQQQQERAAYHGRGGTAGAPTTPLQSGVQGGHTGGDDRRDDDRDDDQRDLGDQDHPDAHHADDRQRAPAPPCHAIEPAGHHARVIADRRLQEIQHRATDGNDEGDDRQGRKEADHAGDIAGDGQRDQDHGRVQVDRVAVDDGAQELVLEHRGEAQQHEEDDRALQTHGCQRGQQHRQRGHQRPDVWDEAAGEDQDGQWSGQRDAEEDEQDQADDRPDAGQDPRAAQVATHPVDRVPAGGLDLRPMPLLGRLHDSAPQAVAVRQDVVGQEERQDGDRHRPGDVAGDSGEIAGDPLPSRGDPVFDGSCRDG